MKTKLLAIIALLLFLPVQVDASLTYGTFSFGEESSLQDFTTYTEGGTSDVLTVTASTITTTRAERIDNQYFYKDFGTDYFGTSFTHEFDYEITANLLGGFPATLIWCVTNTFGTIEDILAPDNNLRIDVGMPYNYHALIWVNTTADDGSNNTDNWTGSSVGTHYYCRVTRNGTSLTFTAYSDSGRASSVYTVTVTCGTDSFRYLNIGGTRDSTNNVSESYISAEVSNLDISP